MKTDGLTLVIAVLLFIGVAGLIWSYVNHFYEVQVLRKKIVKGNIIN